jgi:DGQHR domain-containing protein
MIDKVRIRTIKTTLAGIDVYMQPIKVKDILRFYYVAVRGKDEEEGAVQRVLNKGRVREIKEYILSGKIFFNSFILNWTDKINSPLFENGFIELSLVSRAAQVLDGQHRLAGLQEAFKVNPSIGENEILVSLCIGLSNSQAAEIFLNINDKQKQVNKSLLYDLYGIIDDPKQFAQNRATDLAKELNEDTTSPYFGMIKVPGATRGEGAVDLSAIVTVLKEHLNTEKGILSKYRLIELDVQKTIIFNYIEAIRHFYDKEDNWYNKSKNPFLKNAGIIAALDFLFEKLIDRCIEKKSFSKDTFKDFLNLSQLLYQTDNSLKGLSGRAAQDKIKLFLETNILENIPEQHEYEF